MGRTASDGQHPQHPAMQWPGGLAKLHIHKKGARIPRNGGAVGGSVGDVARGTPGTRHPQPRFPGHIGGQPLLAGGWRHGGSTWTAGSRWGPSRPTNRQTLIRRGEPVPRLCEPSDLSAGGKGTGAAKHLHGRGSTSSICGPPERGLQRSPRRHHPASRKAPDALIHKEPPPGDPALPLTRSSS